MKKVKKFLDHSVATLLVVGDMNVMWHDDWTYQATAGCGVVLVLKVSNSLLPPVHLATSEM